MPLTTLQYAALCDALRRELQGVVVGYSGGLDSTALLHLLAQDTTARRAGLRAVHVHHGLHADADTWAAHCQRTCDALGVDLLVQHVTVDDHRLGREGAARMARHAAFERVLDDDEILALAHHRDDQAETFLMRALRGSGVDGLAAMRPWRAYANGWLWRPLLDTSHATLREYASEHGLDWIEDPSNDDASLDRNFLRRRLMPLLRTRWPHADAALARSAALASEAAGLLDEGDAIALAGVRHDDALAVDRMQTLPAPRRARILRHWIAGLGLPPLPTSGVAHIETDLLCAAQDAEARFDWAGARIQHWRGHLHAHRIRDGLPPGWSHDWDGSQPLQLPTGDEFELTGVARFESPLRVHARQGGERIVLPGRKHHHMLKHVLQDMGVPPWRRAGMPLLSDASGQLQAAGDSIVSGQLTDWLQSNGASLHWRERVMA